MFYDTSSFKKPLAGTRDDRTHALVVILPRESKRLLARAVIRLPEVRRVLESGWFVVSRGVTPSYIVEELTGETLAKQNCTAGIVTDGRLASTVEADRLGPWVFKDGKLSDVPADKALAQFTARDVSVKGANAIDADGNVGVLAANEVGGTVGGIWPTIASRGCHWITPVSLERLILPSIPEAARATGNFLWDLTMGSSVGLMPVVIAMAVTEIQALEILTGVTAVHVASGGVVGSEGAVILALEGDRQTVENAFELVEQLKAEEELQSPRLEPAVRIPKQAPER